MRQVLLSEVPGGDVDTEGVVTAARAVTDAAERLRTAGDEATGIWSALPHAYDAPEAPTLHAALSPVVRDTTTFAEAAETAATALVRYAEDVAAVQSRMAVTAPLVQALSARIASTPVWRSDASITAQNATLQRQVGSAHEDLDSAADVCASTIRSTLQPVGSRAPTPYLTAPGPRSWTESHQHLVTGADPRTNPFFFLHKTPADVNAWWRSLSEADRRQLITQHPDLVGTRDGIPAAARDEANRLRLVSARSAIEARITQLEARLARNPQWVPTVAGGWISPPGQPSLRVNPNWDREASRLLAAELDRLAAAQALENVVARTTGGPRQLLSLALSQGQPRAVVAVGDVDHASHIGVLVGGTGTTVAGALSSMDNRAEELLTTIHAASPHLEKSAAVITWLDYDAPPELNNALSPRRSVAGGKDLAAFSESLHATSKATRAPQTTLYGHSYGSLVVNEAAATATNFIESIIVGGAPGVGNKTVDTVHKYAMLAPDDPIRLFHPILGETSLGLVPYGETSRMSDTPWHTLPTTAATAPGGVATTEISGHSEYLKNGSTSQMNIATIISGKDPRKNF